MAVKLSKKHQFFQRSIERAGTKAGMSKPRAKQYARRSIKNAARSTVGKTRGQRSVGQTPSTPHKKALVRTVNTSIRHAGVYHKLDSLPKPTGTKRRGRMRKKSS